MNMLFAEMNKVMSKASQVEVRHHQMTVTGSFSVFVRTACYKESLKHMLVLEWSISHSLEPYCRRGMSNGRNG